MYLHISSSIPPSTLLVQTHISIQTLPPSSSPISEPPSGRRTFLPWRGTAKKGDVGKPRVICPSYRMLLVSILVMYKSDEGFLSHVGYPLKSSMDSMGCSGNHLNFHLNNLAQLPAMPSSHAQRPSPLPSACSEYSPWWERDPPWVEHLTKPELRR